MVVVTVVDITQWPGLLQSPFGRCIDWRDRLFSSFSFVVYQYYGPCCMWRRQRRRLLVVFLLLR